MEESSNEVLSRETIKNMQQTYRGTLEYLMAKYGSISWDRFQRLASGAFGTGAVGKLQRENLKESTTWTEEIEFFFSKK